MNRFSQFSRLFLLFVFVLLLFQAHELSAATPADYDTNKNNRIDDVEFFEAVDDWLGGLISNSEFFELLDFWNSEAPITRPPVTPPPTNEPSTNMCPSSGRMIALRNGVPIGTAYATAPDQGFSAPIDLAFASDVSIPSGTNIQLNITSNMPGLEPRNGALRSPVIPSPFYNLGPLTIVGNGTFRNDVTIIRSFEWATFRPYWADSTNTGTFTARATLTAKGCPTAVASGSVTLNRRSAALSDNPINVRHLSHDVIQFSSQRSEPFQIELFDLNGFKIYKSPVSTSNALSQFTISKRVPNGIYLFVIHVQDSEVQPRRVMTGKIQILN